MEIKMPEKANLKVWAVISLLFALLAAPAITAAGRTIYVDDDAAGANDGSSWADAFNFLQDALTAAWSGDEIRVAQGIYKPDQGAGFVLGDREATFKLKNGMAIRGGYAGFDEPKSDVRDISTYETILSGDLIGDDGPDFANNGENSYSVALADNSADATAVLDGFTITGGHANGSGSHSRGAGVYTYAGSPTVSNCIFRGNCARGYDADGAGLFNYEGNPTVTNCVFIANSADDDGGGMCSYSGNPTVSNCTFRGNETRERDADGGGFRNYEGSPRIFNCIFIANSASDDGGGMSDYSGSPTLMNCIFIANTAGESGGGFRTYEGNPTLTNCTFVGNSAARDGGGLWNYAGSPTVTNSVLWDDTPEEIHSYFSGLVITYSDVEGGWPGYGNIDTDPLFVDPASGDYHLQAGSRCIDAGDPNYIAGPNETDLDGRARIIGGRIDMGAYEFRPPRTLYVDDDAAGANDGTSWADAYNYLQDALAVAASGDKVLVAQSIYQPDQGGGNVPGDRLATFQLKNGVAVSGGYAGFGEPDPNERDIELYETILSGDLNGDDGPDFANNGENSYHVVIGSGTNATAVLDGFTITGGNANDSYPNNCGAAIAFGSATITNCTITGNWAANYGGGLHNCHGSIRNCIITLNFSSGYGGGLYACSGEVNNCTISKNIAQHGGGLERSHCLLKNSVISENNALYGAGLHRCSGKVSNSIISRNKAQYGGAGLHNCGAEVVNCAITANIAGTRGAGLSFCKGKITNCIISGNIAQDGGGGFHRHKAPIINCAIIGNSTPEYGGGICSYANPIIIKNCIVWGNESAMNGPQIAMRIPAWGEAGTVYVSHCDVQGGPSDIYLEDGCTLNWDDTSIEADPRFVEPGYWNVDRVWVDGDYHLQTDSPCIDTGDNNSVPQDITDLDGDGDVNEPIPFDLDGNPRIADGDGDFIAVVDMGAYEAPAFGECCFGVNHLRIAVPSGKNGKDKAKGKDSDLDITGTFRPVVPVDLSTDEVTYIIDDGQGHMLDFTIPAGLFRPDGRKREDQKFKFKSPMGSYPELDARFDFLRCRFDLKVKRAHKLRKLTGRSFTVALLVGMNLGEETVEVKLKGHHLEHKKKPKLDCCQ
jgi:hypothetical protein